MSISWLRTSLKVLSIVQLALPIEIKQNTVKRLCFFVSIPYVFLCDSMS